MPCYTEERLFRGKSSWRMCFPVSLSERDVLCVYTLLSSRGWEKRVCFVVFTYLAPPACLSAQAGKFPAVPRLYDVRKGGYRRSGVTACSFFFLSHLSTACGRHGGLSPSLFFLCCLFLRSTSGAEARWHATESSLTCLRTTGVVISFLVAFHRRPIGRAMRNRTIHLRARSD
ncbi:hypothetical protein VTN02DRAFT_6848 [Thermoascus thermophilus]